MGRRGTALPTKTDGFSHVRGCSSVWNDVESFAYIFKVFLSLVICALLMCLATVW